MLKRTLKIVLILIVALCGLLTISGFMGSYAYLLELASHFRVQYALILLPSTLLLWLLQQRLVALLSLSLAVLNLVQIAPLYQRPDLSLSNPQENSLSLLQMNLQSDNQQYALAIAEIQRLQPDILVMEEANMKWYVALKDIRAQYPYQAEAVQEDQYGIMVLSKLPLIQKEVTDFNDARIPSTVVDFKMNNHTVTLIATHPLSPKDRQSFHMRNNQMDSIAHAFKTHEGPMIVVGDLNMTSFSPIFKNFTENLNLYDSRKGFGLQPSWPAWSNKLFMITIDHCLLTRDLLVVRREVGHDIGSDHLPLFVVLKN